MVQAYSKKYFPTELQHITQSRYEDHLRDVEAGLAVRLKPLNHRNRTVREFWKSEPQDIKDEIAAYREKIFLRGESSDQDSDSGEEDSDGKDNEDENEHEATSVPGNRRKKAKEALTSAEAKAVEYHK